MGEDGLKPPTLFRSRTEAALSLSYSPIWCARRDSNPRPSSLEVAALTGLSYERMVYSIMNWWGGKWGNAACATSALAHLPTPY